MPTNYLYESVLAGRAILRNYFLLSCFLPQEQEENHENHYALPPPRAQKTRLTYRELVKDPQGEVSRLYRFLGVDPKPPVRVNATMKMDTASRLADEIENLHEVEEALRGTSYLKELYDLQFFGYADR